MTRRDRSLFDVAADLRRGKVSATELAEEAIARHGAHGHRLNAYKHTDAEITRACARLADQRLAQGGAPPMCGIPISVKDLYGVRGMPTYAGTARRLPPAWERDAWLVSQLRDQGAVFTGKTQTVELAFGAVGINPHWGTPWNPWDSDVHRIPGGSSCGAGVSLWEGSALVALGTDTGGSIRIPASMTGVVGHKSTHGRWPVAGVVPLSSTLDSVGGLTRSVADSVYFFGSVDPAWQDPEALLADIHRRDGDSVRVGVPQSGIWDGCQPDIAEAIEAAIQELGTAGWSATETDGALLDEALDLYLTGGIAGSECMAFLQSELPEWLGLLDPTVGKRLEGAAPLISDTYRSALAQRDALVSRAPTLFENVDVLALPGALLTPPAVSDLSEMDRYVEVNRTALTPTCPVSVLGLCAVTLPVGLDARGMPVGLQLVAPGGEDERALAAALAAERALGTTGFVPNTAWRS